MAANSADPKRDPDHPIQWAPADAPDRNFASIMRLDTTGGWHHIQLSERGDLTGDEAGIRVLRFFFPDEKDWSGQLPRALAMAYLEPRDWGLARGIRQSVEILHYRKEGIRLTVRNVPMGTSATVILRTEAEPATTPVLPLTHREQEIADLVALGRTNIEIGIVLNISARTVQKHLENMFRKLGVESRTALAIRVSAAPVGPVRR